MTSPVTSLTVIASITASAAVAVLLRPSPMTLLGRLRVGGLAPHARQARAAASNLRHVVPRGALLGGVGCGVAVVVVSPAPALFALVAGVVLLRRSRLRAERAAALNRRHAMIELCAALSAELRAGRTPREALTPRCLWFGECGRPVFGGRDRRPRRWGRAGIPSRSGLNRWR